MSQSSLEDELLLFPHGSVPTTSVIYSRLHDLYPAFGLDVCKVVKLSYFKCTKTKSAAPLTAATQKLINFFNKIRKNSGFVYYLVVAKSIGYPDKVINLYRLNLRHKLKSRRLPNRSDIYRQASISVSTSGVALTTAGVRPRASTGRSVEMMTQPRSSTTRPGLPNPTVMRLRRMSRGNAEEFEMSASAVSAELGTGDFIQSRSEVSSPSSTAQPPKSRDKSRRERLSISLSNSSSNDNLLSTLMVSPTKKTRDTSIESYSNSGSDDSGDKVSYNALRCIAVYPTGVLIDQPEKKSKRSNAGAGVSSPQRTNRRRPHLNNASRRCIANIQETLKLSLEDTVFKFRNRQDVCDIFKSVFEYQS